MTFIICLLARLAWGAGQYWLDDFRLERLDGALKNVIRTTKTDIAVEDSSTGTK